MSVVELQKWFKLDAKDIALYRRFSSHTLSDACRKQCPLFTPQVDPVVDTKSNYCTGGINLKLRFVFDRARRADKEVFSLY